MKALLIRGLKFTIRLIIAGVIIGIVAGIVYGGTYVISYLAGGIPSGDYTFTQQYYEAGFCIALVTLSDEVKKYWR
mgnify:FL=1